MAENMENQQYAFLKDWSTEELEQLLRKDTCQDSTNQKMVDFALEVLLEREGYTKTERASMTQKAWDDFQKHYNIPEGRCRELYPMFSEKKEPNHRIRFAHLRRVSIAAALIVILTLGATQVFGLENILTIIGQWTDSIFYFIKYRDPTNDTGETTEYYSNNPGLMELGATLDEYGFNNVMLPTWIPERYDFHSIEQLKLQEDANLFCCIFMFNDERLLVQVKVSENITTFLYEKDDTMLEKYTYNGMDYYIMQNLDMVVCNWATRYWECSITGDLDGNEIYEIIHSIK